MKRIIDNLNSLQRLAILSEMLETPTEEEAELIRLFVGKQEDDEEEDKLQAEIGREIARRKNDPYYASGTPGRQLI